ncbi:tripartite tricarboxylate transporter TctB family protein [Chelativorans sp. AA-79]|uniref:tripartite tricarboxylate transporter TctB family protein n=1 Tax=Chelativorans sp. AA-79 TaxID=3028735 RepID=UPI0023F7036B|nr:tripartite tricarboxylate transporter TctB family protein [Chelativorans sp. AA-79]WEX10925.1 tripartite tricarboxylate transporter TctB family protein [Chelativorans sp. AA-79]
MVAAHRPRPTGLVTSLNMQKLKLNADIASGLLFAVFGGWFCATSIAGLALGNAFRMGPGFFPALVGGLLFAMGIFIAIKGWRAEGAMIKLRSIPWRAIALFPIGLILFGAVMRPLGLAIALLTLCFCSSVALKGMTLVRAAVLSAAITTLCIGIFKLGLGLNLPLVGDWLR